MSPDSQTPPVGDQGGQDRTDDQISRPQRSAWDAAVAALEAGLAVVPPMEDGSKRPLSSWKRYQEELPTVDQVREWYSRGLSGVGIVTGAVSGVELLEFEGRAVPEVRDRFLELATAAGLIGVVERVTAGYAEQTPSGGLHLLWRCSEIERSQKLARTSLHQVLIETRGEGGYVIIAPSNGSVHPSGGCWELLQGGVDRIATVTPEERRELLRLARTLDQEPPPAPRTNVAHEGDERPGDRYNGRPDVHEETLSLLERHGWTHVYSNGPVDYLRRPGKGVGVSASLGYAGPGVLHPWSTSTEFQAEESHAPFAVLTLLEHGGDFSAAARALGGNERPPPPSPVTAPEHGGGLGALSRADSLALIRAHPPTWTVKPILTSDEYGALAGPKGVGKTFSLLEIGVCVTLGVPWLGRFETTRGRVLLLTSEDSRARLWRRADAIATFLGHDPAELDGGLFIHPTSFSAVEELGRLEAELDHVRPALVLLDPAYRYVSGARFQLAEMGAVLSRLQEACAAVGASLLVGHHYAQGADSGRDHKPREHKLSGAGVLEWARVLITLEAPFRLDNDPSVTVTFDISGNSIDRVTLNVRRTVSALDETPNPELSYAAEIVAEGAEVREAQFRTGAERVLAVLPFTDVEALTIKDIGDHVANDGTGKGGMRRDTIRKALNRDLEGRVDKADEGMFSRWWRTS